jgi:chitin disaccharide deacetylase
MHNLLVSTTSGGPMFRPFTFLTLAFILLAPVFAQQPPSQPSQPTNILAQRLGYPANSRLLIIHADDFAMMHTVDTATEEAFDNHWITSASILVPCPWFPEVAQWAKSHPNADLGIHLALNADWTGYRWSSVSPQPKDSSLLDPDGYLPLTTPYVVAHAKMSDVETEVHAQVDKAIAAGVHISHLDTHMGTIVSSPDLLSVYLAASKAYQLPVLLSRDPRLDKISLGPNPMLLDAVVQIYPGVPQSQWLDAYKKMLEPLPPGTYQLIVHLAHNDAEIQGATFDHPDWGAQWRQNDLDLVRSPEFHKFLKDQGFILVSWKDLAKVSVAAKP